MSLSQARPLRGLKPVLLAVMTSALLAGCASTHGLATHGTLLGDTELGAAGAADPARLSAAAFPSVDWWTALGDPQLDALITEALKGTPGLDAADARVRQAMARAGLADAARRATVGASAQISGLQLPQSVAPESLGGDFSTVGVLTMSLAYSPDLWGGKRATWQAALGRANAARVEAQAARLTLSSNIAHAYIALAQAFQIRDAAEAEQTRAAELLQLSRQRVEAGIDNQLQLRQAEGAIASAHQQAQAAQQRIDAGRGAIAALLGKGPDRGLTLSRPTMLDATPPPLPTVLPSELLGHRADLVAARWQVEAAARDIDTSEAAFYPSINLSGLVGLVGGSLADLFSSDALLLQGGPAISLPIFDGGRLRSQLAGSNANHDLAVAQYNQRLVDALREVTDAVQATRALGARIAAATEAHEAAVGASQIARARYGAGIGTQLDVLAAGQPLLQLDQLLATLRAQQLGAMVDLNRALGGGLAPVGPNPAPAPTCTPAPCAPIIDTTKASTP